MQYQKYAGMSVYAGIQDIMEVPHFREEQDAELMDRLGELLCRNGVADVLGIALLHTHFQLNDDELLVEGVYPDHVISKPFVVSTITAPVYAMTWRLTSNDLIPIHWRVGEDPHSDRVQKFLNSPAIEELRSLLGSNLQRFGLIQISELELGLGHDEKFLEETDLEVRTLVSTKAPIKANSIQTAWYFSPLSTLESPHAGEKYCDQYTRRYCNRVCCRTCTEEYSPYGLKDDEGSEIRAGHYRSGKNKHEKITREFHDRVSK